MATDDRRELIRDRIAEARAAKGLTQNALAQAIGVTGGAISQRMARDSSFREWLTLARIAEVLGVSADWLLGIQKPGPAAQSSTGKDASGRLIADLLDRVPEEHKALAVKGVQALLLGLRAQRPRKGRARG